MQYFFIYIVGYKNIIEHYMYITSILYNILQNIVCIHAYHKYLIKIQKRKEEDNHVIKEKIYHITSHGYYMNIQSLDTKDKEKEEKKIQGLKAMQIHMFKTCIHECT
ncbi:hypothetical protein ACJX0J_037600, partial [Zea mays]